MSVAVSPACWYAASAAAPAEKQSSVISSGGYSGPEPSPPPVTDTPAGLHADSCHSFQNAVDAVVSYVVQTALDGCDIYESIQIQVLTSSLKTWSLPRS